MILIAGATGTLGGRIGRRLLARGERVRMLVRPGADYHELAAAGAEPVFGDVKDPASLALALRGVQRVITTVNSAARGGSDTVETVDAQGNRNLIDAAVAAGVEHYVFVSALGASVDSPVPFMRAKGDTEQYLKQSGLSYTILEPNLFMEVWIGMIVGVPLQAGQPVTLVGEGRRRHSFVAIEDVAAFAVAALDRPEARDVMIVIGGPEGLSWRDVVAVFERAVGREIPVRTIEPGESLPGLPDVVSQLAAGMDTYDSVVDMEQAARRYGVQLTPVETFARRATSAAAVALLTTVGVLSAFGVIGRMIVG